MTGTTTRRKALSPELEQEVLAGWPSLPLEARVLWLKVLGSFLAPNAPLLEALEDLDAGQSPPAESATAMLAMTGPPPARSDRDWHKTIGMFADDPVMDAILEAGHRIREAERMLE